MAKKPKYIADGRDFSGGHFIDASLDFNLPGTPTNPGPVRGSGSPISKAAFNELKARYMSKKGPFDTEWVTFSRESILTILAQNDCAGIKFYFVEREGTGKNQLTLVMAGVDVTNTDLSTTGDGQALASTQDTLLSEQGNGYPPTTP